MSLDADLAQPLVKQAADYAASKHAHQKRLDRKTPYFEHCRAVAGIVASATDDPSLIAAAYLHDTIEDTGATWDKLARRFGSEVATIVAMLSMDNRLPEERALEEYRAKLAQAPVGTCLIKVADIIHNAQSLGSVSMKDDEEFKAKVVKKSLGTLHAVDPDRFAPEIELYESYRALWDRAEGLLDEHAKVLGLDLPNEGKS